MERRVRGFETKAMEHHLGSATSGPFRPNSFLFALSSREKGCNSLL